MNYLIFISKICMQIGAILFLSGLFMYIFKYTKLFSLVGDIWLSHKSTIILIPITTFLLMSIFVGVVLKVASFIMNQL
ncbi:DUF2905 family protein [Niallia sp. Krafla_26]|uniref:DUF2905 family protein n=1 Tax=Niallia sp. Krafla_26 TaxID=3064703 RepID=UPI003D1650F7